MAKTIREIASEIGVSKQAVFKKIKREPLSTSLQGLTATVDGRLTVSVDGEKLIKQAFFENRASIVGDLVDDGCRQPVDSSPTDSVDGEIMFLRSQVEKLQVELEKEREHNREKDRQLLETLHKLAESQAALSVGQAAEKQTALAEKIIEGRQQVDEDRGKRKGFFYKIFQKIT